VEKFIGLVSSKDNYIRVAQLDNFIIEVKTVNFVFFYVEDKLRVWGVKRGKKKGRIDSVIN